jgi:amino-acid N-acetyltransferase
VRVRKARLPDAPAIHGLIARFSPSGDLLPRSLAEICENVRDFTVAVHRGAIIGCGALHLYGTHLCEIRSICVDPAAQGRGAGSRIVRSLMAEAETHSAGCICLFTRTPDFFARFGFRPARREDLPDKIFKDCLRCPRIHACDEVAMVRGELPGFAILGEARRVPELVRLTL